MHVDSERVHILRADVRHGVEERAEWALEVARPIDEAAGGEGDRG